MRFDPNGYCGGVLPEEMPIVEKFEGEIVPFVEKHGPKIGEMAMQGDVDAEQVIYRYNQFINGMPHLRAVNFRLCEAALKRWESKSRQ